MNRRARLTRCRRPWWTSAKRSMLLKPLNLLANLHGPCWTPVRREIWSFVDVGSHRSAVVSVLYDGNRVQVSAMNHIGYTD